MASLCTQFSLFVCFWYHLSSLNFWRIETDQMKCTAPHQSWASSSQSSQDLFFWHSQPIHTFAEINGGFNDQLLLSWEHQLKVKLEKIKIDSDYDDRLNGGETDFRCRWSDLLRFIDIYALIWFWSRVRCVFMLWNVDDRMIQAKCLLCLEHLGIRWRDSECQDTTSRPIIFVKKENLKNITKHIELL